MLKLRGLICCLDLLTLEKFTQQRLCYWIHGLNLQQLISRSVSPGRHAVLSLVLLFVSALAMRNRVGVPAPISPEGSAVQLRGARPDIWRSGIGRVPARHLRTC